MTDKPAGFRYTPWVGVACFSRGRDLGSAKFLLLKMLPKSPSRPGRTSRAAGLLWSVSLKDRRSTSYRGTLVLVQRLGRPSRVSSDGLIVAS